MKKVEREKIKDEFWRATTKVWELVYSQQEYIFELKLEIEDLRKQLDERS
jgi:hypothetical protein